MNKKKPLVIYCNGVKCTKSGKIVKKLHDAGYANLAIYQEGIPIWEERNLPIITGPDYGKKIQTTVLKPGEVKKIIDAKDVDVSYVIVDVRGPQEFAEGHIPGAINIPMEEFAFKSEVLPKEKKIVVYCNSGSRSYITYRKLIQLAYPNRFQTIFADWKEAGHPIEK
ncbi:MAG TPA: rhodanese-like domain-containing protein [Dissulfurispiraceae bacterium]|nr:rhodanese-like domain-containing protein [Dissulfurispiraceae bacterium]